MAMRSWSDGPFLVAAAPGAGKTRPALEYAREQLKTGAVRRVAVVCPTTPLTRQWARAAARLGVHLVPDAGELRPPRDFSGVAVTYARVASVAERWASQCGGATLVIADEAHHLGEELAWGEGFARAFGATTRWLLLSGTPFRSDQCPIPGVRYDDGVAAPDVSYSYADAVRDGICRPVTFVPYDGVLQWRSGEELVESSFADAVTAREAGRRYRTAISLELADGLPRILAAAHARLEQVRADGHHDAGGLVVAADGEHARAVAKALRAITGRAPTVVLHTEARAAEKLQAFTRSSRALAGRGQHGQRGRRHPAPARRASTRRRPRRRSIFRQIVGRFVRTLPGRALEPSWLFLPADPVLRAHAAEVERELRHVLRPPSEDDGFALDEVDERRQTERGEAEALVPVAADVAPQMALFGGGPPPPPASRAFPSALDEPDEATMPAFERRALLRDKRHRLVADLRRSQGGTHAEINRWLNRSSGVRRVEDASIEQLERSIELLLGRLSGRR